MLPRFHFGTGFLELGLPPVAVGCSWLPSWFRRRRWFLDGRIPFSFLGFFLLLLGALSSRFSLVVAPVGSQRSDWRWPLVSMASFRRYLLVGPTNQPTDRPIEKKQQQWQQQQQQQQQQQRSRSDRTAGGVSFSAEVRGTVFTEFFFSRVLPSFFLLF